MAKVSDYSSKLHYFDMYSTHGLRKNWPNDSYEKIPTENRGNFSAMQTVSRQKVKHYKVNSTNIHSSKYLFWSLAYSVHLYNVSPLIPACAISRVKGAIWRSVL